MSLAEPSVCILMDCLCFSNDYRRTYFVLWKMEEFEVEESWTQLIKIRYQNLQSIRRRGSFDFKLSKCFPLHLSDHGDSLILAEKLQDPLRGDWKKERQAILLFSFLLGFWKNIWSNLLLNNYFVLQLCFCLYRSRYVFESL